MALLRFLLVIIGIYYLLKFVFRAFFPVIVKKTFDKMQQNQQQYQQKPEGEVTVEKDTAKKRTYNSKDVGDYVDFEEIDD